MFNVDSYYSLHLEKTMNFHNIIILIKSVWNKDKNDYYNNTVLETSASKKCNICHYCCFWNKGFKIHTNAWNRCHNLLMMSMNLCNIYFLNIKHTDYCCIISGISNSEAMKVLQNIDFTEKKGTL